MRRFFKFLAMGCMSVLFAALIPAIAYGNWTANVGYHNPPGSNLGLNFLYMGSEIGVEIGVGWVEVDARDDDEESSGGESVGMSAAGDINFKYFFTKGGVMPYLQAGFGLGLGTRLGSGGSAGAGAGGGFIGAGIMAGSPNLHIYGSFNANSSESTFLQFGVGTDI